MIITFDYQTGTSSFIRIIEKSILREYIAFCSIFRIISMGVPLGFFSNSIIIKVFFSSLITLPNLKKIKGNPP